MLHLSNWFIVSAPGAGMRRRPGRRRRRSRAATNAPHPRVCLNFMTSHGPSRARVCCPSVPAAPRSATTCRPKSPRCLSNFETMSRFPRSAPQLACAQPATIRSALPIGSLRADSGGDGSPTPPHHPWRGVLFAMTGQAAAGGGCCASHSSTTASARLHPPLRLAEFSKAGSTVVDASPATRQPRIVPDCH